MSTQNRAFRPLAQTQNIAVTALPGTLILNYTLGTFSVRLCNIGTQTVYFIPRDSGDTTTATATTGIPLPAGQTEVFTFPTSTGEISLVAAGTGSTVYVTCGEGV